MNIFEKVFGTHSEREIKRIMPMVKAIEDLRPQMLELTDEELGFVVGGGYGYYKVKFGETLADIARYLGVSQSTLISLNNIPNPDLLYAGQTLKYPC